MDRVLVREGLWCSARRLLIVNFLRIERQLLMKRVNWYRVVRISSFLMSKAHSFIVWRTRHQYAKEVLIEVVTKLSDTQALKYSEIVSLDQKIRDFGNHHYLLHAMPTTQSNVDSRPKLLSKFLLALFRDTGKNHLFILSPYANYIFNNFISGKFRLFCSYKLD